MKDYKKPSMQIIDIEQTNILCSSVVNKTRNYCKNCSKNCRYWHICKEGSNKSREQSNNKVYNSYR